MFLTDIWNDWLYRPLFNFLIWMYNNWTDGNLGWAVVYLTAFLRLALLPLTIVTERGKIKNQALAEKIKGMAKSYKEDRVLLRQEVRRLLKQRKVRPWTHIVELGAQLLVLLLLYQVFLRGITGERVKILKLLYDFVDYPGAINTNFYGFDLGMTHDVIWPGLVAFFLFVGIYYEYKRYRTTLGRRDLMYFILFPIGSFIVLWLLPMVKSLFILTSMALSVIIHLLVKLFVRPKIEPKKTGS